MPDKDPECGTVSCSGWYAGTGEAGALETEHCRAKVDMEPGWCTAPGQCALPDSEDCSNQPDGEEIYSCGLCRYLAPGDCAGNQAGNCTDYDEGTSTGLCRECDGSGLEQIPVDDLACGDIGCSGLDHNFTLGQASAEGTNQCVTREYLSIVSERCEALGECKQPDGDDCVAFVDVVVAECGLCRYAEGGCSECSTYSDETPCGPGRWCLEGACVVNPYGDGSDGDLVVADADTVVNDYAWLTAEEVLQGDQNLAVNDGSAFEPGDEVLVWQVQHDSNAGTYEYAHIAQKQDNLLTLDEPLANSYYSGLFDTPSASVTQVVRVPHFKTLTVESGGSITAPAWNGYSGGAVTFRVAGDATVSGAIRVTGRGFRTGQITCCKCDGYQGEGWAGTGVQSTVENHGGGGGSTWSGCGGDASAGGSGGGGYGEAGQTGNDCNGCGCGTDEGGQGGEMYGDPELTRLFLGGGAGSNGRDNNCTVGNGAPGSAGGGMIHLFAPTLTVAGAIAADGGDNSGSAGQDSSGPASGAGGTVYLSGETLSIGDNHITALPGAHGWTHWCCGAPVSGAVGRIRLDYDQLEGTTNPPAWSE